MNVDKLAARIDALLPQTQCRQCGFTGCRPYAEAIAAGQAGSDRCAPGGDEGAREIARVMGVPAAPLDPRYGLHKPPAIAAIDESLCVGCTLCIEACPVDAIVGAAKLMHTVIASNCTGCELCLAPCPVDCISLVPTGAPLTRDERRSAAIQARTRYEHRTARRARDAGNRQRSARSPQMKVDPNILRRAIERARRRLAARGRPEE